MLTLDFVMDALRALGHSISYVDGSLVVTASEVEVDVQPGYIQAGWTDVGGAWRRVSAYVKSYQDCLEVLGSTTSAVPMFAGRK